MIVALNEQGQITIPENIRKRLSWKPGTKFVFDADENGELILGPEGTAQPISDERFRQVTGSDTRGPEAQTLSWNSFAARTRNCHRQRNNAGPMPIGTLAPCTNVSGLHQLQKALYNWFLPHAPGPRFGSSRERSSPQNEQAAPSITLKIRKPDRVVTNHPCKFRR